MYTTRVAFLGQVSGKQLWGSGLDNLILTFHTPVLSEQARCRGEQISGTVGWWGPAPVFVTSLEACVTQSFLPGLHLLTFQQPPNASQPDKVGPVERTLTDLGLDSTGMEPGALCKCPCSPTSPKPSCTLALTGSLQAGAHLWVGQQIQVPHVNYINSVQ